MRPSSLKYISSPASVIPINEASCSPDERVILTGVPVAIAFLLLSCDSASTLRIASAWSTGFIAGATLILLVDTPCFSGVISETVSSGVGFKSDKVCKSSRAFLSSSSAFSRVILFSATTRSSGENSGDGVSCFTALFCVSADFFSGRVSAL